MHLNRFTVDLVTKEPLSERRLEILGKEISNWLHIMGAETDDQPVIDISEKYTNGHEHDATDGRCNVCVMHALDEKNAETVL